MPHADTASVMSSDPLLPRRAPPKDYDAAMGALMSSYGFGGAPARPTMKSISKEDKGKGKAKEQKKGKGKSKLG